MRTSIIALSLLSACSLVSKKGSGVEATELYDFDSATGIELSSFVDVEVEFGGDDVSVDVTCDDNLLEFIIVEEVDDVIVIRTQNAVWLRTELDCVATVTLQTLEEIDVSGSGSVRVEEAFEGLRHVAIDGSGSVELEDVTGCDLEVALSGSGSLEIDAIDGCELDASLSGSGEVEIAGAVERLSCSISGSGSWEGEELETEELVATLSGSGSLHAFVTESARVDISGSGSAHLGGEAEVEQNVTGSGSVVRVD